MSEYAQVKATNINDRTELSFSGVKISELAYIFRSAYPHSYMLVYDIHSEFLLSTDLDEYLENEGFLCEPLDELGYLYLTRIESLNAISELSPLMFKAWLVNGPMTGEDLRRLGYEPGRDPELMNVGAKTGNRESIILTPDENLVISTSNDSLARSFLEFFFERTILDNERLLRPREFEELLSGPGQLIYDTGLVVALPGELVPAADSVQFIGWSLPSDSTVQWPEFTVEVPTFVVECSEGIIRTSDKTVTRIVDYFGFMRLSSIWLSHIFSRLTPYITITAVYFIFHYLFSGGQQLGTPQQVAAELALLWCIIALYRSS